MKRRLVLKPDWEQITRENSIQPALLSALQAISNSLYDFETSNEIIRFKYADYSYLPSDKWINPGHLGGGIHIDCMKEIIIYKESE